ncbi:hypothetical protein Acr_23g0003510 [Actinidia rufa]|uniref:Uncharacterized protein n=1 Tax=Actinidia rufa TaxID=165716 RepID=A0A7J0GMB4_9ERIC|nr:hypothetical protein Acr_23g0003510 [Actinidia rufa]
MRVGRGLFATVDGGEGLEDGGRARISIYRLPPSLPSPSRPSPLPLETLTPTQPSPATIGHRHQLLIPPLRNPRTGTRRPVVVSVTASVISGEKLAVAVVVGATAGVEGAIFCDFGVTGICI